MSSLQDSIENCSICQNSRNKNFLIAPQNYSHIFGYIGPASSKFNLSELLLNSEENVCSKKKNKKHLKESPSKQLNQKDLRLKRDKSQKWIQPGMFLYNLNSHKRDKTKLRYDESDTDFEDLKNPRPRSASRKNKGKYKTKSGKSQKKKSESRLSRGSDNTYRDIPSTPVYCLSNDSLAQNKGTRRPQKIDSEDMHPVPLNYTKNTKNSNCCRKVKAAIKSRLPVVDSEFSIDSTKKLNTRRARINTSTSSMKMKNLKSILNNLFGSIESIKLTKHRGRKYNVSKPVDPEDIDPRIIKGCVNAQMKKPAAAFTNSDFSVNSNQDCKSKKKRKKKVLRKDGSDDSTNLCINSKLKHGVFGSIESIKHYKRGKKKPVGVDIEDAMYTTDPCSPARKKYSKGKTQSIRKSKKKNISKCYICFDLLKRLDCKNY